MFTITTYTISGPRGETHRTTDADRAERFAREGFTVTAETRRER